MDFEIRESDDLGKGEEEGKGSQRIDGGQVSIKNNFASLSWTVKWVNDGFEVLSHVGPEFEFRTKFANSVKWSDWSDEIWGEENAAPEKPELVVPQNDESFVLQDNPIH